MITPYSATPESTVREAIKLSGIDYNSIVYDIGSGDGRVAVEAAAVGAKKVIAIEINELFKKLIDWNCKRKPVNTVEIIIDDAINIDYSSATHVISSVRVKEVEEKIAKEIKPGTKVVTFGWEFAGLNNPEKNQVNLLGYKYNFEIRLRNFEDIQSLYPLTVEELITKMPAVLEYQWAGPIYNSVWIYTKE